MFLKTFFLLEIKHAGIITVKVIWLAWRMGHSDTTDRRSHFSCWFSQLAAQRLPQLLLSLHHPARQMIHLCECSCAKL